MDLNKIFMSRNAYPTLVAIIFIAILVAAAFFINDLAGKLKAREEQKVIPTQSMPLQ